MLASSSRMEILVAYLGGVHPGDRSEDRPLSSAGDSLQGARKSSPGYSGCSPPGIVIVRRLDVPPQVVSNSKVPSRTRIRSCRKHVRTLVRPSNDSLQNGRLPQSPNTFSTWPYGQREEDRPQRHCARIRHIAVGKEADSKIKLLCK